MKKIIVTVFAVTFSIVASAQHSQGSFMVEGGINFLQSNTENIDGSITEKGPKETSFTFSPALGYFITSNLSAGIVFSYSSDKTEDINDEFTFQDGSTLPYSEELSSSSIAIGPYVRYYLMPFERSGVFLDASFVYGFGDGSDEVVLDSPLQISPTETITNFETTQDFTFISTGITPGLIFYITPKMALQATFGFLGFTQLNQEMFDSLADETMEDKISDFEISFNASSLSFGLSFAF